MDQSGPFSVAANLLNISKYATTQELHLLRQLSTILNDILNPIYFDSRNELVTSIVNCKQNEYVGASALVLENIDSSMPYIYRTLKLNHNLFYWTDHKGNTEIQLIGPYIKTLIMTFRDPKAPDQDNLYNKYNFRQSTLDQIISTAQYFPNLKSLTLEIFHNGENQRTTNIPEILGAFREVYGHKIQITVYLCSDIPNLKIVETEIYPKISNQIQKFGINYCNDLFEFASIARLGFMKNLPGKMELEYERVHLFNDIRPYHDKDKFSISMENVAPYIKSFGLVQYGSDSLFSGLANPNSWTKLETLRLDLYKIPMEFIKTFPKLKKLILVDCDWNQSLFSRGNLSNKENLDLIFGGATNLKELIMLHGNYTKTKFDDPAPILNGFDKLDSHLEEHLKGLLGSKKVTIVILTRDSINSPEKYW